MGEGWGITSIFLHNYQPRPELDSYRDMRRGGCWPWKCRHNVLLVWQIPHEGIFPLPAHPMPPCHTTGTSTEHPSTGKRQSYGPCTSESNSASQSGLLLERYKCRVSSSHSGTAMLTSHTTLYNVRASCWGLAFRQHTVLFLFSSGGCCSCFGLGSVPFPQVWGFQKLVNLLTFPHLTL